MFIREYQYFKIIFPATDIMIQFACLFPMVIFPFVFLNYRFFRSSRKYFYFCIGNMSSTKGQVCSSECGDPVDLLSHLSELFFFNAEQPFLCSPSWAAVQDSASESPKEKLSISTWFCVVLIFTHVERRRRLFRLSTRLYPGSDGLNEISTKWIKVSQDLPLFVFARSSREDFKSPKTCWTQTTLNIIEFLREAFATSLLEIVEHFLARKWKWTSNEDFFNRSCDAFRQNAKGQTI